jgi:hypothetical protein
MNEQGGIVEGIPVLDTVLARPAHSSGAEASQREGGGTGPGGADSDMVRQPTPMQQQAPMQVRAAAAAAAAATALCACISSVQGCLWLGEACVCADHVCNCLQCTPYSSVSLQHRVLHR